MTASADKTARLFSREGKELSIFQVSLFQVAAQPISTAPWFALLASLAYWDTTVVDLSPWSASSVQITHLTASLTPVHLGTHIPHGYADVSG